MGQISSPPAWPSRLLVPPARDEGLTFSICAHMQSCAMPLAAHGDQALQDRYLADLISGRKIGGNATTEPDSGSDAFAMRTRAVRDGSVYRLDGRKTFVTNGPVADVLLVYAVTDPEQRQFGGISAFLVDTDSPGLERGPNLEKIGLRTSTWCEVSFTDCVVPADRRLGGEGAGTAIFASSMEWERLLVSFSYVGRMDDTLDRTLRYARERKQFGRPIGKHAPVAHKIVEMKTDVEAARLLLYRAAWEQQRSRRSAGLHISLAKLFTTEARIRSALRAIEVHGGYGCASDFEIERELRNAVPGSIASGTSEVQKMVIARHLGL